MVINESVRVFACEICEARFPTQREAAAHERIPIGPESGRPYLDGLVAENNSSYIVFETFGINEGHTQLFGWRCYEKHLSLCERTYRDIMENLPEELEQAWNPLLSELPLEGLPEEFIREKILPQRLYRWDPSPEIQGLSPHELVIVSRMLRETYPERYKGKKLRAWRTPPRSHLI